MDFHALCLFVGSIISCTGLVTYIPYQLTVVGIVFMLQVKMKVVALTLFFLVFMIELCVCSGALVSEGAGSP
jgi:hypothetical protein